MFKHSLEAALFELRKATPPCDIAIRGLMERASKRHACKRSRSTRSFSYPCCMSVFMSNCPLCLAGASRFLLFLFRPRLESPFQFPGLLNLGLTPKSYGFTLQKFDAWSGHLPRSNPVLQGCPRNHRDLGDLDCRVKLWPHGLNPITGRCHLSTNGFSLSVTQR
jgi:hypothetical protein